MKNSLVFILIFVTSIFTVSYSCSFYPYNEEFRFCFFKPTAFDYHLYNGFAYSAESFSPTEPYNEKDTLPNLKLWFDYCKKKVPYLAINQAIYELDKIDIDKSSQNEMIKYLYKANDIEALAYLTFAKNCEALNMFFEDPWERFDYYNPATRTKYIDKAIANAAQTKDKSLKLRYTFLAIRLCYYNHDKVAINRLFNEAFKAQKNKDILYYWSMHFNAFAETDSALATYYASQVFANAPDKRWAIHEMYYSTISIERILNFATTDVEKANVYMFFAKHKVDKTLAYLKEIYRLNPTYDGLSFLLLREINKIEDWVFTPYYSMFSPSVVQDMDYEEQQNTAIVLARVEKDREYANELLHFINTVDLHNVENKLLWQSAKAHLLFITKQYSLCKHSIGILEKTIPRKDSLLINQLQLTKALCLIANQENKMAVILDEVKTIVMKNCNYRKFVFAIGRELEYKGNTTDAALLYSNLNYEYPDEDHSNASSQVYWKSKENTTDSYYGYFTEYFDYINFVYTPQQVEDLLTTINLNKATDKFSDWKFTTLKNEVPRLYDLLGTKYIRQNKLEQAAASFEKAGSEYWKTQYTSWEYSDSPNTIFDQNPFYRLKYTPAFIPIKDTLLVHKLSITKQLITYLNKANNVQEKERAYYYFLIANCYFNMTQFGNSWMMRRYNWSVSQLRTAIEDEAEFYECNLAKENYAEAFKYSKSRKFKALCLRMMGRCEKNKLEYQFPYNWNGTSASYDSLLFSKNKYYQDLKLTYPKYYEELTSDCSLFEKYFKARR